MKQYLETRYRVLLHQRHMWRLLQESTHAQYDCSRRLMQLCLELQHMNASILINIRTKQAHQLAASRGPMDL